MGSEGGMESDGGMGSEGGKLKGGDQEWDRGLVEKKVHRTELGHY